MVSLTQKEQEAKEKLCLPLDGINSLDEVTQRVNELKDYVGVYKIGMELHTRFGSDAIDAVHRAGGKVFLDLKFYDIPNTMKGAAKAATEKGVYMFNVHASSGTKGMRSTLEGVSEAVTEYGVQRPKVIAVTGLTSFSDSELADAGYGPRNLEDTIKHMARNARDSGLDGVVCSAEDLSFLKQENLGEDFMYVTPGIKGPDNSVGADQQRVATPYNATRNGSSMLVVGRAITGGKTAQERQERAYAILQDMAKAL